MLKNNQPKKIIKLIYLFLFIFSSVHLNAQNSGENKMGAWYMYNGSHKLSNKFALKTMAHFRYFETSSEFQQEIYRLGANYSFNKKTNLTLGVSYSTGDLAYNEPSIHLYEFRFYEDLNTTSIWGDFTANHRFRLEHRFIHKNIFEDVTQNWFRYNLNVSYPISKNLSVYIFNELFLNIDRAKRFAQNWTGGGLLYKMNQNLKIKMGYFQIKLPTKVYRRLQLGVIVNTDFRKK